MATDETGCGPLQNLYVAAREDDLATAQSIWNHLQTGAVEIDDELADRIETALEDGDLEDVRRATADHLFVENDPARLDGPVATLLGDLLHAFGYVAAFVLFSGADSRESVVRRLRMAYRAVGVDVEDVETINGPDPGEGAETVDEAERVDEAETVDGIERTVFRCPYRRLGADRFGPRRVCHDVLDRVDDGYVTFLDRHRDLQYDRPRPCRQSACCYSEVSEER